MCPTILMCTVAWLSIIPIPIHISLQTTKIKTVFIFFYICVPSCILTPNPIEHDERGAPYSLQLFLSMSIVMPWKGFFSLNGLPNISRNHESKVGPLPSHFDLLCLSLKRQSPVRNVFIVLSLTTVSPSQSRSHWGGGGGVGGRK